MRAPALLLLCAACGPVTFEIKPQRAQEIFETNNLSGASCPTDGAPLGTIRYDIKALMEKAGVPTGTGCIHPGVLLDVETHVLEQGRSRLPGDTCSGPQGTVTLDGFTLEYDWADQAGAAKTERLELSCPDTVVNLAAPGEEISSKVDACFDAIAGAGTEWLRIGYNRHASQLRVTPNGRCSANACFFIQFSVTLSFTNVTASLEGCP
jgi:hypothetical protein